MQETRVQYLGQEDLLGREWQSAPVFLPVKSHGWKSLEGYCRSGHKESDRTKHQDQQKGTHPGWGVLSGKRWSGGLAWLAVES